MIIILVIVIEMRLRLAPLRGCGLPLWGAVARPSEGLKPLQEGRQSFSATFGSNSCGPTDRRNSVLCIFGSSLRTKWQT